MVKDQCFEIVVFPVGVREITVIKIRYSCPKQIGVCFVDA